MIRSRISPRFVSGLVESLRNGSPTAFAVRLRLVAPDAEQRPNDPVLPLRLDPAGLAARHQTVDDGLDLVGGRVAGGAQPVGRERVAELAQLGLRRGGGASTTSAPRMAQNLASSSDSAPRSPWFTCSAETA